MSPEYAARTGSINTTKLIKMKRLLLLLTCFIFVFQACEKDEVLKPNETISDKIEFKVSDGILSFDSGADFFALGEKLTALSQEELVRWENENGFISLQTEVETAFEMLERCETVEEFDEVMSKNADIIKDEDDYIMPVIRSGFHSVIANRQGYYIVEGILYKVTSEGVYLSSIKSPEIIERAIVAGLREDNQDVNFFPSLQSRVENGMLKSGSTGSVLIGDGAWLIWGQSFWNADNKACKAEVWINEVRVKEGSSKWSFNYYARFYQYSQKKRFNKAVLERSPQHHEGLTVIFRVPDYLDSGYRIIYKNKTYNIGARVSSVELQTARWWDGTSKPLGSEIIMTQAQIDQIGTPKPYISYAKGDKFWTDNTTEDTYATIRFGW
jgi:hypothetical protein